MKGSHPKVLLDPSRNRSRIFWNTRTLGYRLSLQTSHYQSDIAGTPTGLPLLGQTADATTATHTGYHLYTRYCRSCLGKSNCSSTSGVKFSLPTVCRTLSRHKSISGRGSAIKARKYVQWQLNKTLKCRNSTWIKSKAIKKQFKPKAKQR